jgi:hypothetical protein
VIGVPAVITASRLSAQQPYAAHVGTSEKSLRRGMARRYPGVGRMGPRGRRRTPRGRAPGLSSAPMARASPIENPEVRSKLIDALRAGATRRDAALYAGVSEATFHRWMQRAEADDAEQVESTHTAFASRFNGPRPRLAFKPSSSSAARCSPSGEPLLST